MIITDMDGIKYKATLREGWKAIFKTYGGYLTWKQAKINSLRAKGQYRLAEWYASSTFPKISSRDGIATQSTRLD